MTKKLTTTTSIRIEIYLFIEAKRRGLNLSQIMNAALRGVLKVNEDGSEEREIAELMKSQTNRVKEAVVSDMLQGAQAISDAFSRLQPAFNAYIAAGGPGGRPAAAKLSWIEGRIDRLPALKSMTPGAILAELEGSPALPGEMPSVANPHREGAPGGKGGG